MEYFNTHEAKSKLSWIILQVEKKGREFRICRNGIPVADIVPIKKKKTKINRLRKHPVLSKGKILGDITGPLSEEDWPSEFR